MGRHFLDLFRFEVIAETQEDRDFHWKLLMEDGQPMQLEVELGEDDVFPVTVSLEEMRLSGAGEYMVATISRETPPIPPAVSAPTPASTSAGPWNELEEAEQIGLFVIGFPHGPCRYSATWKRLLGYEPRELPDDYNTFIKLIHPEDSEAAPDQPDRGEPNSRSPFSVELRMRHKAGDYLWVHSVGTRQYGSDGSLERVVGFHLDIEERKEIEEQSLQNEERFLTLLRHGKLGFFDLDFRFNNAFFSPALEEALGYKEGELEGGPDVFRRLIDARMPGGDDLRSVFAAPGGDNARTSFARELRMERRDGTFINLHTHIIRLTNRRGELTRVLGIQAGFDPGDPPVWTGTEPAILFAGLQAVNEAVVLTDSESRILFFNEKAEALTGFEAANVLGLDLEEVLLLLHAVDRQPAGNLTDKVLASGNSILFSREYLLDQQGNRPRQVIVSCLPLRTSQERIAGGIVIFRDPKEMSLTPDELVKSNRMESLGLLASGVAHDFNNLLTSIVGGISLAREVREWGLLENSEKACLSAKNLTYQLLTFARTRSSERKPAHIKNLINDCVRLASSGSRVKPDVRLSEDLHPVSIDPVRISQVFQNLIINAIQEMDTHSGELVISGKNVSVATGEFRDLDPGDYVRIDFADNGNGIPEENLGRIFNPFFSTKKTGTGLGLSTVASIVRDHKGRIEVESEVGVGTTFSVYLPKSAAPVEAEARRVPTLKIGTGRILFMDDDEEIVALAEGMLKRLEYEFDIAKNGEEAITLYRRYMKLQRPYDAVILDLTIIGGMGGEETFEELRKLDPNVRAIVSSGYNTDDSNEYYLNKGFYGVLAKPYRSTEMGKLLRHVLGKDEPTQDS